MRKVLLGAIALVMVTPFLYMVSVSFMGEAELLRWPPPLLPHAPTTANYSAMVEALPYGRVLLNTAILAAGVMVAQVFTSAAAGYALARLRFPGREGVLPTLLALLSLPAFLLLIPRYLMIHALGWADTYPPLVRPAALALAVLAFLDQWRNFLWPLVITRSPAMQVAEVALARVHTAYAGNWPYQMAAAVLLTVPVFLVCVCALRYIMLGVRFTGARVRL